MLDDTAFKFAADGFLGLANKRECELIKHTFYSVESTKEVKSCRKIVSMLLIFSLLISGWGVIYFLQQTGYFSPQTLVVQFDDALRPELAAYSGYYSLDVNRWIIDSTRLQYRADVGRGVLGYCKTLEYWSFVVDGDDSCKNVLARSDTTAALDITDTAKDWSVVASGGGGDGGEGFHLYAMDRFYLGAGCRDDEHCGGAKHGHCSINRCICNEKYFGIRCEHSRSSVCRFLEIFDDNKPFYASHEYASQYGLLRDHNDTIVEVQNHPVFVSAGGNHDGMDIIMYLGMRWGLFLSTSAFPNLVDNSVKGLATFLGDPNFALIEHLESVEVMSDRTMVNSVEDRSSPAGLDWHVFRNGPLADTEMLSSIYASLLCSTCNKRTNPCQNGNKCIHGQCQCRGGSSGRLCHINPLGDGKCDNYFSKYPIRSKV